MNRHTFGLISQRASWMILGVIIAALVVTLWPVRRSSSDAPHRGGYVALVRRGDLAIEVPASGSRVASRAVDIGPP